MRPVVTTALARLLVVVSISVWRSPSSALRGRGPRSRRPRASVVGRGLRGTGGGLRIHGPACARRGQGKSRRRPAYRRGGLPFRGHAAFRQDRKSTRLNSSHLVISYAVFCLDTK